MLFRSIEEGKLLDHTIKMGDYTRRKLETMKDKYPVIDHVRGKGLMIGIQLTMPGAKIVSRCLEKGLRVNCTQDSVLRFMPSMIVTTDEIDKALAILDEVLGEGEQA